MHFIFKKNKKVRNQSKLSTSTGDVPNKRAMINWLYLDMGNLWVLYVKLCKIRLEMRRMGRIQCKNYK